MQINKQTNKKQHKTNKQTNKTNNHTKTKQNNNNTKTGNSADVGLVLPEEGAHEKDVNVTLVQTCVWKNQTDINYVTCLFFVLFVALKKKILSKICIFCCFV